VDKWGDLATGPYSSLVYFYLYKLVVVRYHTNQTENQNGENKMTQTQDRCGLVLGFIMVVAIFINAVGMLCNLAGNLYLDWSLDTITRALLLCFFIVSLRLFRQATVFPEGVREVKKGWTSLRVYLVPTIFLFILWYVIAPYTRASVVVIALPSFIIGGGAFLFIVGVSLRVVAQYYLGRQWSNFVGTKYDHAIVRSGPYAWVRHPIYLSYFFISFGLFGMTGDWLLLGLALSYTILSSFQAGHEEKLLSAVGEGDYQSYRQEVPAGLPSLGFLEEALTRFELSNLLQKEQNEMQFFGKVTPETALNIARLKLKLAGLEKKR